MAAQSDDKVVMTGGSFSTDEPVTLQPKMSRLNNRGGNGPSMRGIEFDDTLSERDWDTPMCKCTGGKSNSCCMFCCWCYHKYMLAIRLGETPFMGLMPCASFALRIKVRTLFGIKGSILGDFFTTMFCEPCAVCQMSRELDHVGL